MPENDQMRRALDLAAEAEGCVSPRPPVGAVVVSEDGRVVGEGATTPSPGPHAEVVALRRAGTAARGGTIHVTLEPCCHTGATGPCTDAIIDAGIARVVAAVTDPDPRVLGRGLRRLREAGIEVVEGVEQERAAVLIEPFTVWTRTGRPFVTLKVAATLDGKVAAADGSSRWITGEAARAQVHDLRARCDAVIVGAGTVLADDPELTSRLPDLARPQPVRVVVDSSGRAPATSRVFDGTVPTIVATTAGSAQTAAGTGAEVVVLPESEAGVDLGSLLDELGSRGMCHVLAEAGPTLAASLLFGQLVDRIVLYLAPKLVGGEAPGMLGTGVKTIADAWDLSIERLSMVGPDLRVDARPGRRS